MDDSGQGKRSTPRFWCRILNPCRCFLTLLGLFAPDDHADEVVKAITQLTSKPACVSLTQTKGDIRAVKVVDWSESGQKQLADTLNQSPEVDRGNPINSRRAIVGS